MATKQTFRFGSRASCYQVIVQGAEPEYLPGTATMVGRKKELVASFGEPGPEYEITDRDGEPLVDSGMGRRLGPVAHIHGHYFDSRQQQDAKGWTDEEHDRVVARVQFVCKVAPGDVWALEAVRVGAPWPTYDTTPRDKIVEAAILMGLVGETIAYESQAVTPRSTVIGPLEKHLEKQAALAEDEAALTAA